MEKDMISTARNIEHRYRKRSCSNCTLFETCIAWELYYCLAPRLDKGKIGCKDYSGKHANEKPMTLEQRQLYVNGLNQNKKSN